MQKKFTLSFCAFLLASTPLHSVTSHELSPSPRGSDFYNNLASFPLLLTHTPTYSPSHHGLPAPTADSDFYDHGTPAPTKVQLGKFLFLDKILSGNQNISCATCHHPLAATGDGLSLPVGEGGQGLGITRNTGLGDDAIYERVPRNATPLFNLGATSMTAMFHDGRVEVNLQATSGFHTPAGDDLPVGILDNVLAAQAMFPVTSAAEMAGQPGENSIADAAAADNLAGSGGVWE